MSVVEGGPTDTAVAAQAPATSGPARFRKFFSRPTLLLLLGGIALPNALALAANIWVDVPPRTAAIAAYAAVALLSAHLRAAAIVPLYLAAVTFDGLAIIAHVFFMDLTLITENIPTLTHVRLLSSPFYAALIAALIAVLAANILFLLRCRSAMAGGDRLVFLLAVIGCLVADFQFGNAARAKYSPAAGIGQPFQSAVQMSGFAETADPARPKRSVLLVLVESLGILRDAQQRSILFSAFDDADLRARYTLTSGTTTFFGATAYGEMRELCQSRSSYRGSCTAAGRPACRAPTPRADTAPSLSTASRASSTSATSGTRRSGSPAACSRRPRRRTTRAGAADPSSVPATSRSPTRSTTGWRTPRSPCSSTG
ncbi:hypothetical protein LDDCCGHA_6173 [Methylobacterium oxalidis]|nr:hypothetical protein LDDCCGHA_6173 [Methylobacterium oxalidis]